MRKFDYFQIGCALAGLFVFCWLAYGVLNHSTYIQLIDQFGKNVIREPITPERSWFFMNVTRAGNPTWTAFVASIAFVIALLFKKYDIAVFLIVNVGVFGLGAMLALKHSIARPRPSLLHIVHENGYSFPSGHALNAVLLYGSLIILVHYYIHNDYIRYAFLTLLTSLIIAIPLSRVYLGVHYLSDVLAGMALGGFLLIMSKEFIFKYKTREVFKNA
ncbi:phosphatase PAP2 family protein [Weissella diestrammenae]|uniref:Phosphatase PAP2 family protein n=1 Tax=Weissella diestrammenae TaxID=1162633 RepID=A0A7G9T6X7_9LACO|nr:phosphatase PAP2 family protein [Weissella diestrammenae]MCM0582553.1 phosphatase PAP2 family protein [Weissella diestrammenae]QNN75852.1 phosphatase PAP2 family protein [Weissella diestrammenae]